MVDTRANHALNSLSITRSRVSSRVNLADAEGGGGKRLGRPGDEEPSECEARARARANMIGVRILLGHVHIGRCPATSTDCCRPWVARSSVPNTCLSQFSGPSVSRA